MDYIANIDLSSTNLQLVLASQRSGTFFCVYAQFTPNGNNEYNVNFKIINYRGFFNIGIKKVELSEERGQIPGNLTHVKIYTEISRNYEMELKQPLTLMNGELFVVERASIFNPNNLYAEVSEDEYINIEGKQKTQYTIEKQLVGELINDLKDGKKVGIRAPTQGFCYAGISKILKS